MNTTDTPKNTAFAKRAIESVVAAWNELEGVARGALGADIRASLPKEDVPTLLKLMRECVESKGGDVSARNHTVELGEVYARLNEAGKSKFLSLLATEFDLNHDALKPLLSGYGKLKTPDELSAFETELRAALITPRSQILRQFTALPNGFKFLVNLRADVLPLLASKPELKGLEFDLQTILSSWFDIGLLDLVEIKWDASPAGLLEKLMQYEAVHQINSWDDLRNRLDSDRKIYAFFHNKMPLEPLIFVQVAFVKGFATSVQQLLDTEADVLPVKQADTAIFYSISNAQKGLTGISFGNFLIKRVVEVLSREFKHIDTFATLSPIPGFRTWLDPKLKRGEVELLTASETKQIKALTGADAGEGLLKLLNSDWHKDKEKTAFVNPLIARLAVHYLLKEKKGNKPLDPVANFHLFNGARLERINLLADTSTKGMKQSAGLMVNYHYRLSDIDENHERFVENGKIVASRQVKGYL
jgi:malonyl-CoA decarboxylase